MTRPAIPSAVKRQLRQEAGFGCCICGHPFVQYHHIVPWSEDQHFRVEDMMALCGQCHPLATAGALEENDQRAAKKRPKNIADRALRGRLYVNSRELKVRLAGGLAIDTPNLLDIRGRAVLRARLDDSDGRVLVSALIQSSDGQIVGLIEDNEWTIFPHQIWDFEAYPRHATVRLGSSQIAFQVDSRNDELALQGNWFDGGTKVAFTPTMAVVGTNQITGMTVRNCGGFLAVG